MAERDTDFQRSLSGGDSEMHGADVLPNEPDRLDTLILMAGLASMYTSVSGRKLRRLKWISRRA